MKLKKQIVFMCAGLLGAVSCEDSGSKTEIPYYKITVTENEHCRVDIKEQEKAGEKVEATITVLDVTMTVASVAYNGEECTFVSGSGDVLVYEFTMPQKNVTLTVNMKKLESQEHSITTAPNDDCEVEAPEKARGGEL